MEPTGEVDGTVLLANGSPSVGASVVLDPSFIGPYRATTTDTGGSYRFTDVSAGTHQVLVAGPNGLTVGAQTTVVKNTIQVVNLQLTGTGTLTVHVDYARGVPAIGASVTFVAGTVQSGNTDAGGNVSFVVPLDMQAIVTVQHPDNSGLSTQLSTTVSSATGNATVSLTLPAGAVVAIVGENGAGKTTLVKLLAKM